MLVHNNTYQKKCQKKSYNKNYLSDKFCHKFSDMNSFDFVGYANWFNTNFALSPYKSLREVAKKVGVSPETISRIARAGNQLYTEAPSRPKIKLVDDLSDLFNRPRNEGRKLAGWANEETDDALVADGLFEGYYELPEEKRALARRQIAALIRTLQEED